MASMTPRRTKIVATIGPACSTPEKLRELVGAALTLGALAANNVLLRRRAARRPAEVERPVERLELEAA